MKKKARHTTDHASLDQASSCPEREVARSVGDDEVFAAHLEICAYCRGLHGDLSEVREQLKDLPRVPFPDDALGRVLAATVDAPRFSALTIFTRRRFARAAAVILLVLTPVAGWLKYESIQNARLERSVEQFSYVLGTTARALRTVEKEAVSDVLLHRLAAPINRISSECLERLPQISRRSGT